MPSAAYDDYLLATLHVLADNRGSRISFKNDEPYGHRSCALTIGFCYTGGRSVVGKLGHDETHVTRQSRIANQPQPKLEIDVPPMGLT